MAHSAAKKQRCLSAIQARIRKHGPTKAMRLVSDLENISYKTLNAWYYRAEAEKSEPDDQIVYPTAGSDGLEDARLPITPAAPPEPAPAYLNTEGAQLSCSRCRSRKYLRQDADQLWWCDICQVHLPHEEFEDYKMKYTDSPYRKLHWMA